MYAYGKCLLFLKENAEIAVREMLKEIGTKTKVGYVRIYIYTVELISIFGSFACSITCFQKWTRIGNVLLG